jgi:flavin-dependent thymidylate synthase
MRIELLNAPTAKFIDRAIGQCWGKGPYDHQTKKGMKRIERICNKMKHSSMLRFAHLIFEFEFSTSVLLELSRHQVGVNLAVKSSRYCTRQNPDDLEVELSKSDIVNEMLLRHIDEIITLIKQNPTIGNDDVKLLLPQGFIYKGQMQFNVQSLQHFLTLRLDKSAHFHIREVAQACLDAIPEDLQYLFEDIKKLKLSTL